MKKRITFFTSIFISLFFYYNAFCEEVSTAGQTETKTDSQIEDLQNEIEKMKDQIQNLQNEADARRKLKSKKGDKAKKKSIEDILKASAKRYTLIKRGNIELQDTLSYSYYADDKIETLTADDGTFSGLQIDHSKEHTLVNTISAAYGIQNNLNGSINLPFVYKYEKSDGKEETDIGDISFGLQYQPFRGGGEWPNMIFSGSFKTQTGRSKYEINPETELSTGSGTYSCTLGVNGSKVIDPVVAFGGFSYTCKFKENLNQRQSSGAILTKVDPGETLSYSLGLGYSLTYNLSFTASFQQSYSHNISYWIDGEKTSGFTENSAMLVFGTGIRLNRKTSLYINIGSGLTEDSADFMISFRLPLQYSLFD